MPQVYRYGDDDGDREFARFRRAGDTTPANVSLARHAVGEALRPYRRALRRPGGIAVVVEVPSASWVEPVSVACQAAFAFDAVYGRTGASKLEHGPTKGSADAAASLARGDRVLGVSPSAASYLPAALVASADVRVRIGQPSGDVISRVVRAATGRNVRVPDAAAAGLEYDEIAASIRVGDTPARALARLLAARDAKSGVAATAGVPPFESLRGYGEAHRFGLDLIESVRAYRAGADPRTLGGRACVLASEPGLGKTTMVRSLAKSAGLPLIEASVANWFTSSSGYLDGVLKSVEALFARANGDCLVMLDEAESLPSRDRLDSRNRDYWTPVIALVLVRLEEALARRDAFVAVVAATNHPDRLDPALVRPGRLDRVVRISRPGTEDLAAILRQHLDPDLPGADLRAVAYLAAGATGARAAMIVRDARARARTLGRDVRLQDLLDAVSPPTDPDPDFLRRACVHEAGHAVAIERHEPGAVTAVSVVGDGTTGGSTSRRPRGPILALRADLEAQAVTLLAGRAAEILVLGEASAGSGGGEESDLARATLSVVRIHGSLGLGDDLSFRGGDEALVEALRLDRDLARGVEADLRRLMDDAVGLVEREREAVEAVAAALAERRALSGDEVRSIVAEAAVRA